MPTTLQKAINGLIQKRDKLNKDKDTLRWCAQDEAILYLESLLPEDEQMIRDTWEAAEDWVTLDDKPDMETYINNLKK